MWYACNHIFSHLCDCDMLAGERSVVGSLGLVPGSLWGSAILVWELRSVRSRAMSTRRERPSDGTAELSQEAEILSWWCGKRNWPAAVWRSALRWGRGARCCRGSPRRRSLATKLPRDWSPPALPVRHYIILRVQQFYLLVQIGMVPVFNAHRKMNMVVTVVWFGLPESTPYMIYNIYIIEYIVEYIVYNKWYIMPDLVSPRARRRRTWCCQDRRRRGSEQWSVRSRAGSGHKWTFDSGHR